LWVAAAWTVIAAGGGGGGGGAAPVVTPTPTLASNQREARNASGTTILAIERLEIEVGDTTAFVVLLRDAAGAAVAGRRVRVQTGAGLLVVRPAGGEGVTDEGGRLAGELRGVSGGGFSVQAIPVPEDLQREGLPPVILNMFVLGAPQATPTATLAPGQTVTPAGPTPTPTAAPVERVATLLVQASPFSVSSAIGGRVAITVSAFDGDNVPVPGVRVLLDANPRVGTEFEPQIPTTDETGKARSVLTIQPGAQVGAIRVTASAGAVVGDVSISVVSGASERPVATVVLESDQPVIGTDSGGTSSLRARVLDADNVGIPDVNVLFQTEVGQVSPAVAVTCGGSAIPCPPAEVGVAQATLIVPPNALIKEYNLQALAGGVVGSTTIAVVPGRGGTGTGNPNAAPGEPASISLGASPTRIQVGGTGGTSQSTVVGRVFDNNNNPLANRVVALRVVNSTAADAQILALTDSGAPPPDECLKDPARSQALGEGRLAVAVSDRAGFVLASIRAGTKSGTVTVEACADSRNLDGQTTTTVVEVEPILAVAAGPPARVSLAVNSAFVDNNDGTLLTTVAALVKDVHGNTVEDGTPVFFEVLNRSDVSIVGAATTNQLPACDGTPFPQQTGVPVTAQPGTAITCMVYPAAQAGTVVRLRAESGGVTNEGNNVEDEEFALPPGSLTGPQTGVPSARGFSLATEFRNLSGRVQFGLTSTITAFVADRNGNPVSRNTLVRFTASGGGITSQNTTDLLGRTVATLRTQNPIPPDGIAVVTATVRGEEDFDDIDGDGIFTPGIDTFDPHRHDQNGDGQWSADTEIRAQIPVVFSGPTRLVVEPASFLARSGIPTCFSVRVSDDRGNPIVGGSVVRVAVTEPLKLLGPEQFVVPDVGASCGAVPEACEFEFCVYAAVPVASDTPVSVVFTVESSGLPAGGNGNATRTVSGFVLAPPPTPTPERPGA